MNARPSPAQQQLRALVLERRDVQAEEDEVLRKIRAGEKVDHYETIRQHKDGTRLAISLTVSPIRDDRGVIIGASKIARDITERARLQAQLREHTTNTEKLGDVGAVVASTLDREAIIQKVTDTATELTRAEFGAFFYNVRDPKNGEALLYLAGAYAASGRAREAVPFFERALAAGSKSTMAWNGLGLTRLELGDRRGAAAAFRESLRLEPNQPEVARTLEEIGR